jgi:hypothetical protein
MAMGRVVMLAPPPRSVPISVRVALLFGGPLALFGWIFFGFGMIFVLAFGLPDNVAAMFWSLQPQQTASGIATDSRSTGARENRTTVYENRFSFTAANGRIYHGRSYATGSQVSAGDAVTIEYPAANPAHATIQGMRRAQFGHLVLLVTIFPGIGLIFVLSGLISGSRACYLLANGKLAMGTKTSKERTNTQINKQYVYRLTFQFTGEDGQTYQATANTVNTAVLEDEAQEALVYDPQRPTKAVMLDSLPGAPEFDTSGNIQGKGLGAWLGVAVLPALVITGLGYYVWRQF